MNFYDARLQLARFTDARVHGGLFLLTEMEEADWSSATIVGGRLSQAKMAKVSLRGAKAAACDFQGADLSYADLASADLRTCRGLDQQMLSRTFGNGATRLPEGLVPTEHWHLTEQDGREYQKYRAWLDAGAPPGKPRKD